MKSRQLGLVGILVFGGVLNGACSSGGSSDDGTGGKRDGGAGGGGATTSASGNWGILGGTSAIGGDANAGRTSSVGGSSAAGAKSTGGAINAGGTATLSGSANSNTDSSSLNGGSANAGGTAAVSGMTGLGGTNAEGSLPTTSGSGALGGTSTGGTPSAGGAVTNGGSSSAGGFSSIADIGTIAGTSSVAGSSSAGGSSGIAGGASTVLTGCAATPLSTRYFCEDFESGLSNWLVATFGWNTTKTTYQSSTHAITDSPDGNYLQGAGNEITLASSVDLAAAVAPILTFWHKLDLAFYCYGVSGNLCRVGCAPSCSDHVYVEISLDSGINWSPLNDMFCGNNTTTWSVRQLSLSAYVGKKVKIRFRLADLTNVANCQGDGWTIDDIVIQEAT